ncbi:MAG: hypothetical protein ABI165_21985, partial [Bryobacteraceae bacterium]
NNLEPVPQPTGGAADPILTLEQVYGSAGAAKRQAIQQSGQIVFHAVGDTGSAAGPATQSLVADKMVSDFNEANAADAPSFLFHLGDVLCCQLRTGSAERRLHAHSGSGSGRPSARRGDA